MDDDKPENKRIKGRPKKSPPKTSPMMKLDGLDSSEDNCVCGEYKPAEVSIGCDSCEIYWHLSCVV